VQRVRATRQKSTGTTTGAQYPAPAGLVRAGPPGHPTNTNTFNTSTFNGSPFNTNTFNTNTFAGNAFAGNTNFNGNGTVKSPKMRSRASSLDGSGADWSLDPDDGGFGGDNSMYRVRNRSVINTKERNRRNEQSVLLSTLRANVPDFKVLGGGGRFVFFCYLNSFFSFSFFLLLFLVGCWLVGFPCSG
jgi:hypothetical protein